MALNCSRRPMLPSYTSEKVVCSPVSIVNGYEEVVLEKKEECYSDSGHTSQGEDDTWNLSYRENRVDHWSSSSLKSKDIVDTLPSDPFGMDMKTTFTAITEWLEDMEVDYAERMRRKNGRNSGEDYSLSAEWDFLWNKSLNFQTFPSYGQFAENLNMGTKSFSSNFDAYGKQNVSSECDEKLNVEMNHVVEGDVVGICNGSTSCSSELKIVDKVDYALGPEESPHEGFAYALGYLGVKDLLSVEKVCRSLCSMVRGDPLLWMNIHIDQPLNEKVTDDDVVKLVSRAQGHLQYLNLVDCPKVTDDGIKRVLESNSRLTKLSVPGCIRLTIEGIVSNIKTYNSNTNVHGIKHLRIGGLYGITQEHYGELTLLLGADRDKLKSQHKPHFYHRGNLYLPYNDGRIIDIDACPICEKFRLVYDCPAENCRDKKNGFIACRGCTLCTPRCTQCGRCVKDTEYEETFCLELLCSDCVKQLSGCQLKLDEKGDPCGALDEVSCSFTQHG